MELLTRYLYNSKKYNSQYELRQAIFENQRVAFGEFTTKLMKEFEVTEEKYNPIDEMTDEQVASRVRYERDQLLKQTDKYLLPDYPEVTPEALADIKMYRQALRDIPAQEGFPRNVVWPVVPAFMNRKSSKLGLAKVGI